MIYLHKILPIFLLPIGVTLLLLLAGLLLRRRWLVWSGVVLLWICSTPLVGDRMFRIVEGEVEHGQATDAPAADAIVALSAGRIVAPGSAAFSEWQDPDRFFGGVELFKAGKAPLLVFTGGWVPWEPEARPEGEILSEYAKALGVPAERIVTTGAVANTAEEARAVVTLLGERGIATANQGALPRVLLVTSAFHMSRARQLFEHAGMIVIPFPVDFKVSAGTRLTLMDFMPSAVVMRHSEMAWRELYGRLIYSIAR